MRKLPVVALALALLCAGCLEEPKSAVTAAAKAEATTPISVQEPTPAPVAVPRPPPGRPLRALLFAAANGDGDSWKDTTGKEYRLGLINTPEYDECYGSAATAARKRMVADGFRASVYTTDTYGRLVSVVTTADGTNLNVWLARHGLRRRPLPGRVPAREPRPGRPARHRVRGRQGGACRGCGAPAPDPPRSPSRPRRLRPRGGCDPSYPTVCIPPPPPDLDCGDISYRRFEVRAPDPHRFDADHDGIGCESG